MSLVCFAEVGFKGVSQQTHPATIITDFIDVMRLYSDWRRFIDVYGAELIVSKRPFHSSAEIITPKGIFIFDWRVMEQDVYIWAIQQKANDYFMFNGTDLFNKIEQMKGGVRNGII